MGYFLTIITSILAISFGFMLYYNRKGEYKIKGDDALKIKGEINGLLTDFNRVSNANINLLEERIRCLKELIEIADEKIEKLNGLISDAQIINKRNRPIITKEFSIPRTKAMREYERIKELSTSEEITLNLSNEELSD